MAGYKKLPDTKRKENIMILRMKPRAYLDHDEPYISVEAIQDLIQYMLREVEEDCDIPNDDILTYIEQLIPKYYETPFNTKISDAQKQRAFDSLFGAYAGIALLYDNIEKEMGKKL